MFLKHLAYVHFISKENDKINKSEFTRLASIDILIVDHQHQTRILIDICDDEHTAFSNQFNCTF